MEFYIKKGATLPVLKYKVVKDGRSDYHRFYNYVNTDSLYFSMVDYQTKIPKVTSRKAKFVQSEIDGEYYAVYQLKNRDTNDIGRYEGSFLIKTDEGTISLNLKEKIYINVVDSILPDLLESDGCYTSDNPCCPVPSFTPTSSSEPEIILEIDYSGGSIYLNYNLTTSFAISQTFILGFTHILEFFDNTTITLNPTITIPFGSLTGHTQLIVDANFNNLKYINNISNITTNIPGLRIKLQVLPNFPTPTPTPTPTLTPSPTITNTPTITVTPSPTPVCYNGLMIENGYILTNESGNIISDQSNPCFPTPTPTPICNVGLLIENGEILTNENGNIISNQSNPCLG